MEIGLAEARAGCILFKRVVMYVNRRLNHMVAEKDKEDADEKPKETRERSKDRTKGDDERKGRKTDKTEKGREGAKKEEAKDGEEVEIVEEKEVYLPSQKAVISSDIKKYLKIRREIDSRRPAFRRQEWFRYGKFTKSGWRKPRGKDSKMRRHYKYRPTVVSIGYGSPGKVKNYHPSGFRDVLVHNMNELRRLNPDTEAARIAHTVGTKKRMVLETEAEKLGVRVLNMRR